MKLLSKLNRIFHNKIYKLTSKSVSPLALIILIIAYKGMHINEIEAIVQPIPCAQLG